MADRLEIDSSNNIINNFWEDKFHKIRLENSTML